jgi:hypothetical protein
MPSARPWLKRREMETARHRYNNGRNIIPLEQHGFGGTLA